MCKQRVGELQSTARNIGTPKGHPHHGAGQWSDWRVESAGHCF
jgi:hypothetical protein